MKSYKRFQPCYVNLGHWRTGGGAVGHRKGVRKKLIINFSKM